MTYKNRHTFLLDISPERTFLENWSQFLSISELYIPVSFGQMHAANPNDRQEVLDFIDIACAPFSEDMYVGIAYTDPGLCAGDSLLATLDSATALRRFYKNRSIQGLTFNPPGPNQENRFAFTAYRSILPRVVGMLLTHHLLSNATGNIDAATSYCKADMPYQTLFHAALAREEGEPLDACFFLELDALFSLGMIREAQEFMQWYRSLGSDPRLQLFDIRLKSMSGHALESLEQLKAVFLEETPTAAAWLEKGRALMMSGQHDDASAAFDQSLALEHSTSALLGKGLSLRAKYYNQQDEVGLKQALTLFEEVIAFGGYHSSEALHHAGTIHGALQDWQSAERCYRQCLAQDPSPMSKQNLTLCLHAQGKMEEARKHFTYLTQYFPAFGRSLEKYFQHTTDASGNTVAEPAADALSSMRHLNNLQVDRLAEAARTKLKKMRITMKNDAMDFRRFDDYVSYHAPAGEFLETSALALLTQEELQAALLDVALHLGKVLVDCGLAAWHIEPEFTPYQIGVFIKGTPNNAISLSLYANVIRRVDAGGSDNSLVSLDMLVAHSPEYTEASRNYINPFSMLPADEDRLEEFAARALRAQELLSSIGYTLTGEITDIRELEIALSSIWSESEGLALMAQSGSLTLEMIDDIGFYFGALVEELGGGEWYDHHDMAGISLQGMMVKNIHPVLEIRKRVEIGPDANEFNSLLAFEPPLVCANLCLQLQSALISTREELMDLLATHLPTVLDEDPSGNSLVRMADMIEAYAKRPEQ